MSFFDFWPITGIKVKEKYLFWETNVLCSPKFRRWAFPPNSFFCSLSAPLFSSPACQSKSIFWWGSHPRATEGEERIQPQKPISPTEIWELVENWRFPRLTRNFPPVLAMCVCRHILEKRNGQFLLLFRAFGHERMIIACIGTRRVKPCLPTTSTTCFP